MSFPRYPKYKPSGVEWLGDVPEGWEVKPLKFVATYNDDVIDETTPPETEILYVDISAVDALDGIKMKEPMAFSAAPSRARWRGCRWPPRLSGSCASASARGCFAKG